ncbi:hypothetical protein KKH27_13345 [bacterium]|nr:hypothetical protein [bacterium]MBU1984451.1 hypothetical protein [bacterium]
MKIGRWTLIWGLVAFLGCSAPHDNPLDPKSDRYPGPPPAEVDLWGRARSVHISRHGTSDTYSVVVELDGPDVGIVTEASVTFEGSPPVSLRQTIASDMWTVSLPAGNFTGSQLGGAIGLPFLFTARDADGRVYEVGPVYMWRVITDTPLVLSPSNGDTVSAWPVLEWQAFAANFTFGYRAEIVNKTEAFETVIWTSSLLPSNVLSLQMLDSLSPGDYYWTLTVVDSFANSSRSKQGAFVVDSLFTLFSPRILP